MCAEAQPDQPYERGYRSLHIHTLGATEILFSHWEPRKRCCSFYDTPLQSRANVSPGNLHVNLRWQCRTRPSSHVSHERIRPRPQRRYDAAADILYTNKSFFLRLRTSAHTRHTKMLLVPCSGATTPRGDSTYSSATSVRCTEFVLMLGLASTSIFRQTSVLALPKS